MVKKKEPKVLVQGKKFHKEIQKDWKDNAEGEIFPEKHIKISNGKTGRMDIFIQENESYVVIGEIKNSDWDSMTSTALRHNVKKQIRQVWKYISSQLKLENDVTPGIIFPRRPQDIKTMNMIEKMFEEEGISVVWDDESIQERKERS